MAETMYAAPGIGLAATQVDVHERVIVIDVSEARDQLQVFINPEIVAAQRRNARCTRKAACRCRASTTRSSVPTGSRCARSTSTATAFTLDADGLLAVCVQHEIDHLERPRVRRSTCRGSSRAAHPRRMPEGRARPSPDGRARGVVSGTQPCRGPSARARCASIFAGTPEFAAGGARRDRGRRPRGGAGAHPHRPARGARPGSCTTSPVKLLARAHGLADRAAAHLRDASAAGAAARARRRCDGGRGLRADPARRGAAHPAPRLPEHPRVAAAALARRRADPARHRGRRQPRPASPSCRWTKAWTPGRCCWRERDADRPDDTGGSLHDRLAALGARAIVAALDAAARAARWPRNAAACRGRDLRAQAQPRRRVDRLERAGARASSTGCARSIRCRAPPPRSNACPMRRSSCGRRALPGGRDRIGARTGRDRAGRGAALRAGTVLLATSQQLVVACGDGAVELRELQRPGGRRLPAARVPARLPDRGRRTVRRCAGVRASEPGARPHCSRARWPRYCESLVSPRHATRSRHEDVQLDEDRDPDGRRSWRCSAWSAR